MPINHKNVELPEWLFHSKSRSSGASPTDSLNLISALNGGDAWEGAILPSAARKPKSIVITKANLVAGMNVADLFSMASWFKANDFQVFVACENKAPDQETVLKKFDDELEFESFEKLAYFDFGNDYTKLSNLAVSRDRSVVLVDKEATDLKKLFAKYKSYDQENFHAVSQGYEISFHKDFDEINVRESSNQRRGRINYLVQYNPKKALEEIKLLRKWSKTREGMWQTA